MNSFNSDRHLSNYIESQTDKDDNIIFQQILNESKDDKTCDNDILNLKQNLLLKDETINQLKEANNDLKKEISN